MRHTTVFDPTRFRKRRRRTGLSQVDVAAAADLTQQAISLIERGLRRPRPGTVVRLLSALRALEVPDGP
jgi:transcriptional regulator with XRE-family HTH domain